jgi:hypothetical protein
LVPDSEARRCESFVALRHLVLGVLGSTTLLAWLSPPILRLPAIKVGGRVAAAAVAFRDAFYLGQPRLSVMWRLQLCYLAVVACYAIALLC